jgi:hypothetical protein
MCISIFSPVDLAKNVSYQLSTGQEVKLPKADYENLHLMGTKTLAIVSHTLSCSRRDSVFRQKKEKNYFSQKLPIQNNHWRKCHGAATF